MTLLTWMEKMGGALRSTSGRDRRGSELQLCWREASEVHTHTQTHTQLALFSTASYFTLTLTQGRLFAHPLDKQFVQRWRCVCAAPWCRCLASRLLEHWTTRHDFRVASSHSSQHCLSSPLCLQLCFPAHPSFTVLMCSASTVRLRDSAVNAATGAVMLPAVQWQRRLAWGQPGWAWLGPTRPSWRGGRKTHLAGQLTRWSTWCAPVCAPRNAIIELDGSAGHWGIWVWHHTPSVLLLQLSITFFCPPASINLFFILIMSFSLCFFTQFLKMLQGSSVDKVMEWGLSQAVTA